MFNGIIYNTGIVKKIEIKKKNCTLVLNSKMKLSKTEIGSSISCSGVCLTVEKIKKKTFSFYLSKETLKRTIFSRIAKGSIVNLEKSLKYGNRISGHFVQGHVDLTSNVKKINILGKSWVITFSLPLKFKKYCVEKGSITINGVSLTISKMIKSGFQVSVIPQTLKLTNLIYLKKKDVVNVEFDVLGKYINNFLK